MFRGPCPECGTLALNVWKVGDTSTECLKFYRKSVLHLLKYTANLNLSRFSTDLR